MISASHNAMPDNGIKIFAAGGLKLDDAVEDAIESRMDAARPRCPTGEGVGRIRHAVDADRATWTTCWSPPRTRSTV